MLCILCVAEFPNHVVKSCTLSLALSVCSQCKGHLAPSYDQIILLVIQVGRDSVLYNEALTVILAKVLKCLYNHSSDDYLLYIS